MRRVQAATLLEAVAHSRVELRNTPFVCTQSTTSKRLPIGSRRTYLIRPGVKMGRKCSQRESFRSNRILQRPTQSVEAEALHPPSATVDWVNPLGPTGLRNPINLHLEFDSRQPRSDGQIRPKPKL